MSRINQQNLEEREQAFYNQQESDLQAHSDKISYMEGYEPTQAKIEPRRGRFTASRISELLAGGSGKTRMSYILDCALAKIGIKDDFESAEMRHGTVNQINAFDKVVKPMFKSAEWYDKYIPINDDAGSSPDVKIESLIPLDCKCPYTIFNYLSQKEKLPKKYYLQSQMQMMSLKSPIGYMLFYLTKPEFWGQDDWEEYPIPLKDRFHLEEIKADEQSQYEILQAVEAAVPVRDNIVDKLTNAKVMSIEEFFYSQMKMNRYRKIKEASNLLNIDYIRVGKDFFYEVK